MKKGLSASIPDYFSGSYDEFQKKREKFFSYFESSSSFSSSSEFYRHSLSKEGAQAYAECVGAKQNKLFVAYIFNEDPKSGSRVSIGFSTKVGGNTTVNWEVRGEKEVTGFPRKGWAGSSLKCDTAHPVRCRSNATSLLALHTI